MKDNPQTQTRPPIVVVMGHVDHGKTTLLDYIRKTKVAEKEAGGITQHVGAYEVEHQGKKITFIDTPGHEAFSKMRSRGAKVADIAILVVAADEGVKEQTLEALSHIKEAEMPYIVAINKIDKPGADTNKLKGALAEHEVVVESWGGKIPSVEISAKLGTNIDQLLELILLMAEMEELKGDAARPAEGVIIESHLDPRKGPLATLLVKEGTLKVGDFLACGGIIAKIKNMNDFTGRAVASASFSSPLAVSGFQEVPDVGADCKAAENKKAAEHIAAEQKKEIKEISASVVSGEKAAAALNIVLKADVSGSLEALAGSFEQLAKKVGEFGFALRVAKSGVGEIGESDIKFAESMKSPLIVGFKVKVLPALQLMAQNSGIRIINSDIIYELLDIVKKEIEELLPPEIKRVELGQLKILAIFGEEKGKQIVGGRVAEGKIKKGALVEVLRRGEKIGKGKVAQLQQQKKAAEEAREGTECGILFDGDIKIAENDVLAAFEEEKIKRKIF